MRRIHLTKREYEALLMRQNGLCCVAGCGADRNLIAEHSTPHAWRAAKPDQLMCEACHKQKTRSDIKAICKAKRLNGEALSQYERRKKYGPTLHGRPFRRRG